MSSPRRRRHLVHLSPPRPDGSCCKVGSGLRKTLVSTIPQDAAQGEPPTIADNLVARLALYVANEVSVWSGSRHQDRQYKQDSRCEAYTTSILLQLRVIEGLLERQSAGP